MARISDLLAAGRTSSFEFFPPKTDEAAREPGEDDRRAGSRWHPSFVSVTYGAGGSTRERTRDIVIHIQRDAGITAMAHLTCIAHDPDDLVSLLEQYRDAGIENILALAGDPPGRPGRRRTRAGDCASRPSSSRSSAASATSASGWPPIPSCTPARTATATAIATSWPPSWSMADFAITQFFFEAEPYLPMIDELAERGVTKPVLPGHHAGHQRQPGASASPSWPGPSSRRTWRPSSRPWPTIPAAVRALGVEVATELCRELLDAGAPGLHFYTLNRSTATREIYANLGL